MFKKIKSELLLIGSFFPRFFTQSGCVGIIAWQRDIRALIPHWNPILFWNFYCMANEYIHTGETHSIGPMKTGTHISWGETRGEKWGCRCGPTID
jgi:hypothetical protein